MASISNGEIGLLVRTKLNDTGLRKNNFAATTAPGVGNDTTQGYDVGSRWLNASAKTLWSAVAVATGVAEWLRHAMISGAATAGSFLKFDASGNVVAATMTTARLLGRSTAGTGAVEELTVGAGLALSAGVLSATPGVAIQVTVRNATGTTMAKGTPYYLTGANTGGVPHIAPADADGPGTFPADGILAADLATATNGTGYKSGEITGLNTSTFSVGDLLYVGNTAGALVATAPNNVQPVAEVLEASATTGRIMVQIGEAANTITALTAETTGTALRAAEMYVATGSGDRKATGASLLAAAGRLLSATCFRTDQAVATGLVTHVMIPIGAELNGFDVVGATIRTYSQGVTGATTVQVVRRRGTTDANVFTTAPSVGAAVFAASTAVNTSNDDLATGDVLLLNVAAVHSGTAPNGLAVEILVRKP
jgi:hypothetical protein